MATKSWLDCISSDDEEDVVDNEKVKAILAERLRKRKEESEIACAPVSPLQRSHTVGGVYSSRRSPAGPVVNYGLDSILPASPSSSVSGGGSPSSRRNRVPRRRNGGLMRTSTVQCVRSKDEEQVPKKFSFGFISSILHDENKQADADKEAVAEVPEESQHSLNKRGWADRPDHKVAGSGASTNAPDDDSEETAASPKALTKYYPEYDAPFQMQALQRARDVCN